jgi:fatty-acyl-CoA synthase
MMQTTFTQVIAGLRSEDSSLSFLDAGKLTSLSYGELGRLVARNAEHFYEAGVRRGDGVAISMRTDVEHVVAFLALMALGAVPFSLKPPRAGSESHASDVARLCGRFRIHYCYHTLLAGDGPRPISWRADAAGAGPLAPAAVSPDDVAFVQFSSGSTSDPKAVPITHRNLMANLSAILAVDARRPDEAAFNFLPLCHDMGLVGGLLSNLVQQNPVIFTNTAQLLHRPAETLAVARDLDVHGMAMPDFALRYLGKVLPTVGHRHGRDLLSKLRLLYCGAEPIRHQTVSTFLQAAEQLGLAPGALFFCYGLAEATLLATGRHFDTMESSFDLLPSGRAVARLGAPIGGIELRIRGRRGDGAPVTADGEEGAVELRGPSVFRGYWGETPREADGWFDTGDVGYLRNNELYISGREKEMMIVNGENIFPNDIESSLTAISGIRESLAMFEDERLYLLIVPAKRARVDTHTVSTFICRHFGVSPAGVAECAPGHIFRTSSGKPMRGETLKAARERMLLPD